MKKMLSLLMVFLLVFSMIVVADDAVLVEEVPIEVIEEDCGFLCTAGKAVGKFLFGSKEARALVGTAWFDRTDALVGRSDYSADVVNPVVEGPEFVPQAVCFKGHGVNGCYIEADDGNWYSHGSTGGDFGGVLTETKIKVLKDENNFETGDYSKDFIASFVASEPSSVEPFTDWKAEKEVYVLNAGLEEELAKKYYDQGIDPVQAGDLSLAGVTVDEIPFWFGHVGSIGEILEWTDMGYQLGSSDGTPGAVEWILNKVNDPVEAYDWGEAGFSPDQVLLLKDKKIEKPDIATAVVDGDWEAWVEKNYPDEGSQEAAVEKGKAEAKEDVDKNKEEKKKAKADKKKKTKDTTTEKETAKTPSDSAEPKKPEPDLSKAMGWGTVFGLNDEGVKKLGVKQQKLLDKYREEYELWEKSETYMAALEKYIVSEPEIGSKVDATVLAQLKPGDKVMIGGYNSQEPVEVTITKVDFDGISYKSSAALTMDGGVDVPLSEIMAVASIAPRNDRAYDLLYDPSTATTKTDLDFIAKAMKYDGVEKFAKEKKIEIPKGKTLEDKDVLAKITAALEKEKEVISKVKYEAPTAPKDLEFNIPGPGTCKTDITCTIRTEQVLVDDAVEEKQVMYFVNEKGEIQQSIADDQGDFKTVSGSLKGITVPKGVGILGSPFKDVQVDNGKTTGIALTNGMTIVRTMAIPELGQEGAADFTANVPTSILETYTKGGIAPRVTKDGVQLHTIAGIMGTIFSSDPSNTGVVTSTFTPTALAGEKATSEKYWNIGTKELAKQTPAQLDENKVTIDGQSVFVSDSFDSQVKKGEFQYYEDKDRKTTLGDVKVTDQDIDDQTKILVDATIANTNYKTEVRTTTLVKDGTIISINDGDCYKTDCETYHPNSGVLLDSKTGLPISLLDFDYAYTKKGDSFGEDRGTMTMETFDPGSGTYTGESYGCKDNGKCGAQFIIDRKGIFGSSEDTYSVKVGGVEYPLKEEGGKWVCETCPKGTYTDELQKQADDGYQSRGVVVAQKTVESVYAVLGSVKSYSAISKIIGYSGWDPKTWLGDFGATQDELFSSITGMELYTSPICERSWDIEPDGKRMIKTASGTYQPVASIQAERTSEQEPMLCERNPDPEAEEEWVCGKDQVCYENVCYDDIDADGDPDDKNDPKMGYFYKVTWAVSAPIDEAFTPYRDENGIAVSFNIWLDEQHLYIRRGDKTGPIELKNGDSDKQVITKYSPLEYEKAWIKWDSPPKTIPIGGVGAKRDVTDVSFDVVISEKGQINWKKSGQPTASTKSTDAEVEFVTEWK